VDSSVFLPPCSGQDQVCVRDPVDGKVDVPPSPAPLFDIGDPLQLMSSLPVFPLDDPHGFRHVPFGFLHVRRTILFLVCQRRIVVPLSEVIHEEQLDLLFPVSLVDLFLALRSRLLLWTPSFSSGVIPSRVVLLHVPPPSRFVLPSPVHGFSPTVIKIVCLWTAKGGSEASLVLDFAMSV